MDPNSPPLKRRILLTSTLSLLVAGSVRAEPAENLLPIRLFSALKTPLTQLTLIAPFTLAGETFSTGQWQLKAYRHQLFLRGGGQPRRYGSQVMLQQARGLQISGQDPRRYRGMVQIEADLNDRLQVMNWIRLEEYLLSVVPSEMPADWPSAALQVQAIVARTLALPVAIYPRPQNRILPTVLQDSTANQFYGGQTYETSATTAAVRATQGQILRFESDPIVTLFHSTCGGHTSANQDIFAPPARPYLQGVVCEWCRESPFYGSHLAEIKPEVLEKIWGSRAIRIRRQDPYGRPMQVEVGSEVLSGQEFWLKLGQTVGWGVLPSNRYKVEASTDSERIRLVYQGAGHGVGLCQWGARGQAAAGWTVERILKHYYPESELVST